MTRNLNSESKRRPGAGGPTGILLVNHMVSLRLAPARGRHSCPGLRVAAAARGAAAAAQDSEASCHAAVRGDIQAGTHGDGHRDRRRDHHRDGYGGPARVAGPGRGGGRRGAGRWAALDCHGSEAASEPECHHDAPVPIFALYCAQWCLIWRHIQA